MLKKVQAALTQLLTPGEPILVGVSGGPDSVALLDVLVELGWRPHVCHLNHRLRGADSDADAEFVRQLGDHYRLPNTIEARTVDRDEDAARRARFHFFREVALRTGLHKLALAHTADDQVETFLFRLLRGSGVSGLVGIWPERQMGTLRVIRPMLGIHRTEVLEYLSARGLKFREDASNRDTRFTRNRIRHELLPLLEREFNPAIRNVLLRTAQLLGDEDSYLTRHVMETVYPVVCQEDTLAVKALADCPVAVQRRLLRVWLGGEDENGSQLTFDHIEAVRKVAVSECPSAEVHLPNEVVVYREYGELKRGRRGEGERGGGKWFLKLDGETAIRELRVVFHCCHPERSEGSLSSGREICRHATDGPQRFRSAQNNSRDEESFDADALGSAPFIRTWQEGDRFQPLGMREEKKLQDFFVDEKVPRLARDRVPLLCATDGRIAWVVGHRMAEPFKVTDATRRVLQARVKSGS